MTDILESPEVRITEPLSRNPELVRITFTGTDSVAAWRAVDFLLEHEGFSRTSAQPRHEIWGPSQWLMPPSELLDHIYNAIASTRRD